MEQKRFVVGGAKYTEELKRFHQLQDEYLLLVNNDIKDIVGLVKFRSDNSSIRCGMWECRKNWMS